jgi:hypothetical protein
MQVAVSEITVYQSNATIEKLERARLQLAECKTLEEVKRIRDVATAARVYAKAAHLCRDAQQFAAEITLTASRKAGEILKQLDKTPAGGDRRSDQAASVAACSEYSRTLDETGTPERTARYWQTLADVPEETVKRYVADVRKTDDGNGVELREIRFRGCPKWEIDAKVTFGENYSYTVLRDETAGQAVARKKTGKTDKLAAFKEYVQQNPEANYDEIVEATGIARKLVKKTAEDAGYEKSDDGWIPKSDWLLGQAVN